MIKSELAQQINQACRLEGTFVLRSGQVSNQYFDKYLFESQPALLRHVAEAMVALLPPETDILGGLELGGIPLATMVSSLTDLPVVFVRKQAKTYGTCRLAEGGRQRALHHPRRGRHHHWWRRPRCHHSATSAAGTRRRRRLRH